MERCASIGQTILDTSGCKSLDHFAFNGFLSANQLDCPFSSSVQDNNLPTVSSVDEEGQKYEKFFLS